MAAQTVERTIHFYRPVRSDNRPFDPGCALTAVDDLPPADRYADYGDGVITCWVDQRHANQRARVARIRRQDLPQVEEKGKLQDLELAEEAGLAYPIHVMFFAAANIVGSDFNFYGPRMSAVAYYLGLKAPADAQHLQFQPLIRNDVRDSLRRLQHIKVMDLRVNEPYIDQLQSVDQNLYQMFEQARQVGQPSQMQVILSPARYSRTDGLTAAVQDIVLRLLDLPDLARGVTRFRVEGPRADGSGTDHIDLLNDFLVYEESVVRLRGRSRSVDASSAYSAINKAFRENYDELINAATLS